MSSQSLATAPPPAPPATVTAPPQATRSTLSSLCSSCHARPPRYRCPRCLTRTCSLACTRTHKTRTLCSGVRDPGAYASRAQLNSPAAFDRDFNFISGVERGIERAARDGEVRGIGTQVNGSDANMLSAVAGGGRGRGRGGARGGGRGGGMMRGGGGGGGGRGGGRGGRGMPGERPKKGEVPLLKSLARDAITVLRAPKGMSREKENKTQWRRRGGGVSWTIEWIELEALPGTEEEKKTDGKEGHARAAGTRMTARGTTQLHDSLTLKEGLAGWRTRAAKRRRGDGDGKGDKEEASSTEQQRDETPTWTLALDAVAKQSRPGIRTLLPFDASLRLCTLLRGQTVREFPTVYVWQGTGPDLHDGFDVLEKLDVAEDEAREPEHHPQAEPRDAAVEGAEGQKGGDEEAAGAVDGDEQEGGEEDEEELGHEAEVNEEDDEIAREREEDGDRLEIERGVMLGADSNLGISGSIAAALMADLGGGGDQT